MLWYWNHADRPRHGLILAIRLARAGVAGTAVAVCCAAGAWAQTNISGVVTDAVTGHPVSGARVVVHRGGDNVGSGATEADGIFQVFASVPAAPTPQSLTLSISRSGYADASHGIVVVNSRPDQLSYRIALPRNELAECDTSWTHTVVVGNVRPPVTAGSEALLSERVGEVLQYDLSTELQKTHLPPAQQPVVVACPRIQPKTLPEHVGWVNALKTEALIVGAAEPVGTLFRVDLQVTARHGPAGPPARASTPPMNLNRPASADLGRAALGPILTALLKAYRDAGQFSECVEFANAAERAVGAIDDLAALRSECQSRLPNGRLLTDGGAP